ncbi:MAG: prepilin-type N-terminal cleavage/methylation domain-containing protein [Deltaproteobacteria bacterium]|nr:prepilin-type N-terminal cleavage/methylation domain-containing protein [Deltaproteobacteria bacterium]
MGFKNTSKDKSGFTLIELAVVIVIVGIIISIVATILPSLIQSAKIRKAKAILEKVDYSLEGYITANGQCPCPDTDGDGLENRTPGANPPIDDTCASYVANLPYRTLGISSGEDNWHNPIKYAVYEDLIRTTSSTGSNFFCYGLRDIINYYRTNSPDTSKLYTTDSSGNDRNQAYVIVSGGPKDLDGTGGFFDGLNSGSDVQFESPNKIVDANYDDLVRAVSFSYLSGRDCAGSGAGGSGGGGVENSYPNGCTNGIDDDGDLMIDCDDPDCAGDPACLAGGENVKIATESVPSGNVNSDYSVTFTASGGITPYEWELTANGGFTDFYLHPYTGHLSGTLSQCPGNYSIQVKVSDSTQPTATTDTKSFNVQVTSDLEVARTSGDHSTNITWDSPAQEETFETNGGHLGDIDWTLDTGGATGFSYVSTGADTCKIKKNGSTTAGTYTFTLTAKDHDCSSTNTANIVLTVEVTVSGAGAPNPPDAEWRMDECSWNGTEGEVTDSSESGLNPGTSKNGAFTIGTGKICRCASTDTGSAYILLNPVLDISADWTIAAWFYWPLASTGSSWWTLTRGTNDHQILVNRGSNLLGTYDNKGGTGWHSSGFNMSSLSVGWHHIAAVGSGTETKFYIDATLKGTADYKSDTDIKTLGNYIGGNQNWGKFDELKVWNKALSEDEISQEYAASRSSCSGTCYTEPIADYRMENFPWNGTAGEVVDSGTGESNGVAAKAGSGTLPTQTTPSGGKVCRAGVFSRVDANNGGYLDLGDPADGDLDPGTDPWTMSAWIKWGGSAGENIIYNKENLYETRVNGGYIQYAWQPHWAWDGGTSFPVTADTWTYVTIVYDGFEQILYKDGVRVYSRPQTGAIGTNSSKLLIGARGSASPRNFFGGMVDEVKIYNRALAENEIKSDKDETRDCSADTVVITTTSLPDGTINSSYSYTISATGGTTPYGWEILSSGIPGLSIVPNTGELHGTIDVCAGDYNITVRVTDAGSRTDERIFTLAVVNGTLSVSPSSPQTFNCTSSTFYQDFSASGPRLGALENWAVTWHGTNPGGFEVISTGEATVRFRKSGTSTIGSGYQFKLTARDSVCNDNEVDSGYYTLNISGEGGDEPYYTGMVGEWRLDECAWDGTTDEISDTSGTNAHGESHNMGSADTVNRSIGKVCYSAAVNLDTVTNQYVNLGHEAFQNLGDFSLSMWFRIDSLSSSIQTLFSGAKAGADNTMLIFLNSTGTALTTWVNQTTTGGFNIGSTVADGLWHHLVWTRKVSDGTEVVYIDKAALSDTQGIGNTSNVTLDAGGAILGQEQDSVGDAFDVNQIFHGWIDEVMVYNKVLTQTDVNNLYSLTHDCVGSCYTDAIAWYYMDEDSWTTGNPCVIDSIGGYDGTPTGDSSINKTDSHLCYAGEFADAPGNDSCITITGLPVSTTAGDKTTVCFWMKWAGNGNEMPIGWANSYDLFFYGTTRFGFNTGASDLYGIDGANALANDWYHVAAIFSNNAPLKNQLYIDGTLQPIAVLTGTPVNRTVSSTFYISGWSPSDGYKFNGMIDELRIYTRGLSSSEVTEDMNLTHSCPGP